MRVNCASYKVFQVSNSWILLIYAQCSSAFSLLQDMLLNFRVVVRHVHDMKDLYWGLSDGSLRFFPLRLKWVFICSTFLTIWQKLIFTCSELVEWNEYLSVQQEKTLITEYRYNAVVESIIQRSNINKLYKSFLTYTFQAIWNLKFYIFLASYMLIN